MKKQISKQAKKASKLAKAENLKKEQAQVKSVECHPELVSGSNVITVKNAEGDLDTTAEILIQNQIDYTPKVSVIIPVYNVEHYLRECLDSVVNQTLKEIEIICVDDGSTDSSIEILKEYAAKDKRMTIIRQQNLHAGVARNAGLSQAKGEYIAFMDGDDFYPNHDTLEHIYTSAKKNKVLICGGSLYQLKNGKLVTDPKAFDEHFSFDKNKLVSYQDYQFVYGYWRFIYNRQFLKDNNICFPKHRRFQDPIFCLKAMHQASQFYALREATYVYRIINKNKEYFNEVLADMAKGMKDVVDYAFQHSLTKVYDDMYTRLNTKWMKTLLSNKSSDGRTFLQCIGPKRICDEQLENIDKIFKKNVLVSSFMGRDYFRYLSKKPNTVEEYAHITQKPECTFIHGSGTWYPQPETIEYAIENNIPLVKMEDGFLRSADTWCNHAVDKKYTTGIAYTFTNDVFYFDATQSSFMERQINNQDFKLSKEQKKRTQNAIRTIIDNYLTKYNHQPIFEPQIGREGVKKILVVDQSYGDFSIKQGLADDNTFKEMLEAAIKENPEADIIIKTHPDAIAPGTKKPLGYYSTIEEHDNIYIMRQPINPISLLKYVDKVYVCTTQFGFEALLCGKEVHTFGMPFYAGWGLTIDKLKNPRRTAKRTLEELFYIAYIKNTYYVDPANKCPCSIERAMEYLIELREEYRKYLTQPRISVIIPVYNVEKYLRECLNSTINQSYKNIEIICVNDGSTDSSLKILEEYAKKDNRIKIIDKVNGGLSSARNAGLDNCNSEFVYFLDSDDYIAKETIETLYKMLITDNADVAIGGVKCFGDEKTALSRQKWIDSYKKNGKFNIPNNIRSEIIPISCNKLYKTSFIEKYAIQFPEKLINEDEYWLWAYMIHCKTYSSIDKPLYFYRQRSDSIMGRRTSNPKMLDIIDINCKIYETMNKYKNKQDFEDILSTIFIGQVGNLYNLVPEECMDLYRKKILHYYNDYNHSERIKKFYSSISVKVSVIIPVYNTEKYLRECLDSATNQTLKDIEIICIDDGSTDNSLNILNEYSAKDKRVKILTQQHKKQGAARNFGIEYASGQYVFFMDSDDFIKLETLENLYKKIEQNQADFCQYLAYKYDNVMHETTIIPNSVFNKVRYLEGTYNYKINPKLVFEQVEAWRKLYRKDFLIKNDIKFFENSYFEDTIFHIKCISLAKRICFEDNAYYYYRKNREGQTTGNSENTDKFLDIFNYINGAEEFFREQNMWKEIKSYYYAFVVGRICSYYVRCNDKTKGKFAKKAALWTKNKKLHELKQSCPEKFEQFYGIIHKDNALDKACAYLLFPYYLFKVVQMRKKIYPKQNSSGLAHFLYHKVKTDSYTKTYICGIKVKKKPANIYEFIDKRLAKLSNNWEKKLNKIAETIEASDLNNRAEILEQLCQIPQQIAQNNMVNKKEITENHQKGLDDLLKNLKQYYVSRSKTDNYSLEFRTFADIAHCIRQNLKKIPNDVDLVVGVPRSGMIPAYIIALFMNKKCCSLDEFLSGSTGSNGNRKVNNEDIKKVLIVDDSVYNGTEMGRTREKLEPLTDKYHFIYATVYVKPDSEDKVDIWLERVPAPRVWQWNYLNHSIAKKACFDMDGVLCIDPTADENDDGEKYLEFIAKTKPLYIPTYEINAIVTSRLEKYREQTEKWLKDHGAKYKQLIMLDLPTAEERRKLGCHAKFKAEVYKKLSDTVLFVESEPNQAREIALLTGKTVICTSNDEVY